MMVAVVGGGVPPRRRLHQTSHLVLLLLLLCILSAPPVSVEALDDQIENYPSYDSRSPLNIEVSGQGWFATGVPPLNCISQYFLLIRPSPMFHECLPNQNIAVRRVVGKNAWPLLSPVVAT